MALLLVLMVFGLRVFLLLIFLLLLVFVYPVRLLVVIIFLLLTRVLMIILTLATRVIFTVSRFVVTLPVPGVSGVRVTVRRILLMVVQPVQRYLVSLISILTVHMI